MQHRPYLLLLILILGGLFFRFYNLFWGAPFYFHPDERNIAGAISQLKLPLQMNPHFFAYGSLPIYFSFFLGIISSFITEKSFQTFVSFEQAIQSLRIISAVFSVLLIPLLYICGKKLQNNYTGLLAALFGATSIGFIQFAHFGTFEMWLTLLSLLLFLVSLFYIRKPSLTLYFCLSLLFALLVSTKVSSIALLPLVLLPLLILRKHKTRWIRSSILSIGVLALTVVTVFLITNPYAVLDYQSFRNSISYETEVATGELSVFYTGEFFNTVPILFHIIHVYPFLLNPLLTMLFLPSFFLLIYLFIKNKRPEILLLLLWFLFSFLPQTVLFVKWTRYVIPTLPFIYLIIALALNEAGKKFHLLNFKYYKRLIQTGLFLTITICILFAISYTYTSFVQKDTRVAAFTYAKNAIPSDARIVSEVYDLGITPFNEHFQSILLFNFYDLEHQEDSLMQLNSVLASTEYVILPSQRLLKSRLTDSENFPLGYRFYTDLLQEKIGFRKIYETPCDVWCRITYWNDPIFAFEQTANIFDRPTVQIFQKDETR